MGSMYKYTHTFTLRTRNMTLIWILVFGATVVQACEYGWFGSECDQNATQCATERCNGHGVCTSQTFGCECDVFWYNTSSCNLNATQCRTSQCHGYGECTLTAQTCLCDSAFFADAQCSACLEGFTLESGCTQCSPGYYGPQCTWNATECGWYQCNAHGQCRTNETDCLCDSAWNVTETCGQTRCITGQSRPSLNGSHCECVSPYAGEPDHCVLACSFPHGIPLGGSADRCQCSMARIPSEHCRDIYISVPVLMLWILSVLGLGCLWLTSSVTT